MAIPLLDLKAQYAQLKCELDAVWFETMESSGFIGGPKVTELEERIAEYCGTSHAVACASGTDALFLMLAAAGIRAGDEVITTPFTFWATVEAIVHVGAVPVFVDIEPGTYNLDATKIAAAVTERTKAIVPVHVFGQCADMDTINAVADEHGLIVVEDACQAIGATYRGRKAGSLARASAFSFFPSKNLGCAGDGGMITTDDEALADEMRLLARHGSTRKYYYDAFGTNSRLDALQAAILLAKLPHLDQFNAQRSEAAATYSQLLAGVAGLQLPLERDYGTSVWHLYVVKAADAGAADAVMASMRAADIGTAKYYPLALHEQPAMLKLTGWTPPSLPVAESCDECTFALPAFPGITGAQLEEVASVVRAALGEDRL